MDRLNTTIIKKPAPIPALTGLRFIAAFAVMLAHGIHWIGNISPEYHFIHVLGSASGIGMPLFFVLSGFVIQYNYSHYFSNTRVAAFIYFMIARIARLYPLYILMLVIFFLSKNVSLSKILQEPYISRYLTLTQAWQFRFLGPTWIGHLYLAPAWSISIEWFLYIFFALIGVYYINFKLIRHALIAFAALVIVYYSLAIFGFYNIEALNQWTLSAYAADVLPQSALLGWLFNVGPLGRFFEFFMGALSAQIFMLYQKQYGHANGIKYNNFFLYASLIIIFLLQANHINSVFIGFVTGYAAFIAPLLAFILFSCASSPSLFARMMSSRVMVVLGDASYSMYLIHAIFLPKFYFNVDRPSLKWICVEATALLTVMGISLLSYRFYEVPARKWVRRALMKLWQWIGSLDNAKLQKHTAFFVSLCGITFICAIVWVNRPDLMQRIQIIEASYGGNCKHISAARPITFYVGNATMGARQRCLHKKKRCSFPVKLEDTGGDPAPGCAKDYTITYRCDKRGPFNLRIPGEAFNQRVNLACK